MMHGLHKFGEKKHKPNKKDVFFNPLAKYKKGEY